MKKKWILGAVTGLVVLGLTIPAAAKGPFHHKPKVPKSPGHFKGKKVNVPEPATFGLVGAGLASIGLLRRGTRPKE